MEMEVPNEMKTKGKKVPHLVLFPLPYQGHINPMMHLASFLHSRGFSITVILTHFNSLNPSDFPNFRFQFISDGLSDDEASNVEPITQVFILNERCEKPFHDCLSQIQQDSPEGLQVMCIITDVLWYFTQAVADRLMIPRIALQASSATYSIATDVLQLLRKKGCLSSADFKTNAAVPDLPLLRFKDLPDYRLTNPEILEQCLDSIEHATKASLGFLINTLDALEKTALEKVRQKFHVLPFFPIGPLHKFGPCPSNGLLRQDHSCIAWLDKQAPQSVVYISFGSLASVDERILLEIAWGVANSEQPFLWVIRPGSILSNHWIELPTWFEEKTKERSYIVKWAPQQDVLAHPSVGCFWTHSGWNSTLESICEGVPMICSPYLWDQQVNARYTSHVLRVGLQLEDGFERGEIERAIRRLMVENEGKEMRERASVLKENALACIRKGGSSYESLQSVIDLIISL